MKEFVQSLEDLIIFVRLGCTEKERNQLQAVNIKLTLAFPELPLACRSDDIKDIVCYAGLSDSIQVFCEDRAFKLLEYLAYELFQFLKRELFSQVKLSLCLSKKSLHPQLDHFSFMISD